MGLKHLLNVLILVSLGELIILSHFTVEHENAHKAIMEYYGFPPDHVKIRYDKFLIFKMGGDTYLDTYLYTNDTDVWYYNIGNTTFSISREDYRAMMFLHSLNEIINYNLESFLIGLFYLTNLLIIFMLIRG